MSTASLDNNGSRQLLSWSLCIQDDEGEDAADAAGPASVTAEGDLAPQTTGAGGQVMQYPAAEHSHEEVLADRTVFLDDLAKLHTDLGSTLRYSTLFQISRHALLPR